MLLAKPMQAFSLQGKQVLVCHVPAENPNTFVGKDLWFYTSCGGAQQIRIEGISTASNPRNLIFDFHYSGGEISPDEITEGSLLADGPLEKARRELASISE